MPYFGYYHYYLRGSAFIAFGEDIDGYLLIFGGGIHTISARQVGEFYLQAIAEFAIAYFFFDRYAWIIPYFLIKPRKSVKQGGFTGIRIAHKGYS